MGISAQRWKGGLDGAMSYLIQRGVNPQTGTTYQDIFIQVAVSPAFADDEKLAFRTLLTNGLKDESEGFDYAEEANGRIDYMYVSQHFPNQVLTRLVEDMDYAHLYMEEQEHIRKAQRAKRMKLLKIVGVLAGVVLVCVVIYNLPYFAEKRAYARTLDNPSVEAFDEYVARYDHTDHLPDVLYRKARHYLTGLDVYAIDKARERQCIESLDSLVTKFPNHELSAKAKVTVDSIWNAEIDRFTAKNPNVESSSSLTAMYQMLQYMKSNKVYDIQLNVKPDVDLKEYMDFPEGVRALMEAFNPDLKTKQVLKIKDHFGTPDQKSLEESLISEFTESLNSLFTPGFFTVIVNHDDRAESQSKALPVIDLGYSIKSQVDDIQGTEFPHIWIYSSSERGPYGLKLSSSEDYIMGIEVMFNSRLTFPGQSTPWTISVKGAPEKDINDIENIADGYRIMTRRCFEQFGDQLNSQLGLMARE